VRPTCVPGPWRPLIVVLLNRAIDPPPPQQPKRRVRPYSGRSGKNSNSKANRTRGFNPSSSVSSRHRQEHEILVDAIFSAHSDGLMVILRKA